MTNQQGHPTSDPLARHQRVVYHFVKRSEDGRILYAQVNRFGDGSGGAYLDGWVIKAEGGPSAWEGVIEDVLAAGYVDVAEARRNSVIPLDWHPPAEERDDSIELLVRYADAGPTVAEIVATRRLDPSLQARPLHEVTALLRGQSRWSLGSQWGPALERLERSCWEAGLKTVRVH